MLSKPQTPDDRVTLLRDVSVIAGSFLVVVVSLTAVTGLSMRMQSAVRAYVNGEGLWSKGQKDALHSLVRYAGSGDEADWKRFEAEIAVPLGDHVARLELEKRHPDRDVVRLGFEAGRNDPRDVDDMAMLFRTFRHTEVMSRAIDIWTRGDRDHRELLRVHHHPLRERAREQHEHGQRADDERRFFSRHSPRRSDRLRPAFGDRIHLRAPYSMARAQDQRDRRARLIHDQTSVGRY